MINKFALKNFKCLKDTGSLELGRINLLTGINGKGKSSFLQALIVLSQSWREGKYSMLLPNIETGVQLGSFEDILSTDAEDRNIVLSLSMINNDTIDSYELKYEQSSDPSLGELISFVFNGKEMKEESSEESTALNEIIENDGSQSGASETVDSYPELMSLKNLYSISANRIPAQYKFIPSPFGDIRLYSDGSNVVKFIHDFDEEKMQILNDLLVNIFGSSTIKVIDKGEFYELTIDSKSNSRHLYRPENVGYGYSYILSLITALMITDENGYLIIENPEAHLHPHAQSQVMAVIIDNALKRNIQVFIETHSDHIVNAAQIAVKTREDFSNNDLQILFFDDTIENLQITPKGRILSPPEHFCDQYSKDLDVLY